nr:oligopeptide/dipeptide ABC transporter ATP-binding protein [Halobacterium noricense]
MYAGELVERGTLADIFDGHVHPYTRGLVESIPDLDDPDDRLDPIEGSVPSLLDSEMDDRCYFADRCPKAMEECLEKPPEFDAGDDHAAKCYLADREYDESRALADGHFDEEVTSSE